MAEEEEALRVEAVEQTADDPLLRRRGEVDQNVTAEDEVEATDDGI